MPGRAYTSSSGAYRYGFNGQERDDEIAGEGNINTALFWEYDTRLGRRWNLDPKPSTGVSDYACFGDNPVLLPDVNGDKPGDGDGKKESGDEKPKDEKKEEKKNTTPKISIVIGENQSTGAQKLSGLSHKTLIFSTNQSFYTTNVRHPLALKGNDITEGDHFIQILARIGNSNFQAGATMFKEKTDYNAAGFGYEAPSPLLLTFARNFQVASNNRNDWKALNLNVNVAYGMGTVLGIPRVNGTNFPGTYRPVGTAASLMVKVDFNFVKMGVFFVAVTATHVDMKDQPNTSVGYQQGKSYDSIGLKAGFGINVPEGRRK